MISGPNHTFAQFCRFESLVQDPDDVVWAHGGGCIKTGKIEQIRVNVEQIQTLRGLQKHVQRIREDMTLRF